MHISRAWRVPQSDFNRWLSAIRQRFLYTMGLWVIRDQMGIVDLASYDPNETQPTRRTWTKMVLSANRTDPYADTVVVKLEVWYHKACFYVRPFGPPEVVAKVVGDAEEYGWWPGPAPEGVLPGEWDRRHALWQSLLGERLNEAMTQTIFDPRITTESDFRWWAKDMLSSPVTRR